ncbi:MAG: hypothetical protein ABR962_08080 [Candidatus Bathyarchaeia archaeon]
MTGATIDHLVAFTIFLGALLIFIGLFNQINQTAILYQYHTYIATKCSDMLDSILLNPGFPYDWGVSSNSTRNLAFFGLQDPEFQEYRLSSLSLMRLLSAPAQQAYYSRTGEWYNNVSWGLNGGYLLLQTNQCANYSNANSLLGMNGTYDFQMTITPTLTVAVSQVPANDLRLQIQVHGPGFPLSNATLRYLLFWASPNLGGYPILNYNFTSDTLQTDSSGFAYKDFSYLSNKTAFTFIVKACAGGLFGIGYLSQERVTSTGNLIPYIESFDNGTANLLLAQNSTSIGTLYFNASFYILPDNFVPIPAGNFANFVNYGSGYQNLTIVSSNQTGFLVVAYSDGSSCGMVITSLGVGTLGMSVTFGNNSSGEGWVATDLRQVLVGDIAYQAKLSLWSAQGYQVIS